MLAADLKSQRFEIAAIAVAISTLLRKFSVPKYYCRLGKRGMKESRLLI